MRAFRPAVHCPANHSPTVFPMPHLAKILVYPIKSLDGVEVTQAELLAGGALTHDREFALFDHEGNVINAKRTKKIHTIRSEFDLAGRMVTVWRQGESVGLPAQSAYRRRFHLDQDRGALATWFSDFFGYPVLIQQDLHMGFPDDTHASGPTVVSVATLEAIASWFPAMTVEAVRRRFRANLEIEAAPAFWEDRLFAESGELVPFQIGAVTLLSSNPCQRCIVPTRDPWTGDRLPKFQKDFNANRSQTLPPDVVPARFDHFYKLTTNTQVPTSEAGKSLRLGDPVQA